MSALLRKYNTQTDIYFPLIKAGANDFAASADYTHVSGDVKISKDGGAAATATNSPSAITMGNGAMWKLTLTATEMSAAKVMVTVVDAATKAVEDQMILIETFGNASAEHAFDLNTATQIVTISGTKTTLDSLNDLDAAGIRSAVGLAAANLDTQIAALPTQSEITGGAYALDTDANGRIRIVDGTGVGELDTNAGLIAGIAGTKTTFDSLNDLSAAQVNAEADTALADFFTSAAQLVDDIWNENIDPSAHGVLQSAAYYTRSMAAVNSTINDASATTTSFATNLTEADNFWKDHLIRFTSGSLVGQTKPILSYSNTNGQITLDEALTAAPANGDSFLIIAIHVHPISQIADGVWDEATSGHSTAGTTGKALIDILADTGTTLPAILGTPSVDLATDIAANLTAIGALNDLDAAGIRAALGMAAADLDSQIAALPTQAEITGGAYALDTDANGRIRIVDGTGVGELDTNAGLIAGIAGTKTTLDALNDITVAGILTTQMTESYAANGVAPTLAQCQMAIHQKLMQMAYSGTSSNVYKLDNATLAFSGTLDDATNPTEDRRA